MKFSHLVISSLLLLLLLAISCSAEIMQGNRRDNNHASQEGVANELQDSITSQNTAHQRKLLKDSQAGGTNKAEKVPIALPVEDKIVTEEEQREMKEEGAPDAVTDDNAEAGEVESERKSEVGGADDAFEDPDEWEDDTFGYGFRVGTSDSSFDVINNDKVRAAYSFRFSKSANDIENLDDVAVVPADSQFTEFFFGSQSEDHKHAHLWLGQPFVFSEDGAIAMATIDGWGTAPMKYVPAGLGSNDISKSSFIVKYDCLKAGQAMVTMHLRVLNVTVDEKDQIRDGPILPTVEHIKKTETKEPTIYTFQILKQCKGVKLTRRSMIKPLSIGITEFGNEVMDHGQLNEMFKPVPVGKELDFDSWKGDPVKPGHVAKAFFFHADTHMRLRQPVIHVYDESIVYVKATGNLTKEVSTLFPKESHTLALTFVCKAPGKTYISIAATTIVGGARQTFDFAVLKECDGEATFEGNAVLGLMMGTKPAGDDIVWMGLTRPKFTHAKDRKAEAKVERFVVAADQREFTFFASMKNDHTQEVGFPTITTTSLEASPVASATIDGPLSTSIKRKLSSRAVTNATVTFTCLQAGMTDATIALPLVPTGEVSFLIQKKCSGADPVRQEVDGMHGKSKSELITPIIANPEQSDNGDGTDGFELGKADGNFVKEAGADKVFPGLNIKTRRLVQDQAKGSKRILPVDVLVNGVATPDYHWGSDWHKLAMIGPDRHHLTLMISYERPPGGKYVGVGAPTVSSQYSIAHPEVKGPISRGGVFNEHGRFIPARSRKARNEDDDKALARVPLTINFNCLTDGSSMFTVTVPVYYVKGELDDKEAEGIAPDMIHITFVKTCSDNLQTAESGGVDVDGLNFGTKPNGKDVVFNGYPTKLYFGQRLKAKPSWEPIIVPATNRTTSLYLSFNPQLKLDSKEEEGDATVPKLEDDEDQLSAGAGIDLEGNEDEDNEEDQEEGSGAQDLMHTDEIHFQAPLLFTHMATASPQLSGEAANGGVLKRGGAPLQLDVTYNCVHRGLATVTVNVPIIPYGEVSFTIPKRCDGPHEHEGNKAVIGLDVATFDLGISADGQAPDVLKSGLPRAPYRNGRPTGSTKKAKVGVSTSSSTFYIRRANKYSKESLYLVEPMVFSHRPLAAPTITHTIQASTDHDRHGNELTKGREKDEKKAKKGKGKGGKEIADIEIVSAEEKEAVEQSAILYLGSKTQSFTVHYNCLWHGVTPITVAFALFPEGQVSFTFIKQCPKDFVDVEKILEDEGEYSDLELRTEEEVSNERFRWGDEATFEDTMEGSAASGAGSFEGSDYGYYASYDNDFGSFEGSYYGDENEEWASTDENFLFATPDIPSAATILRQAAMGSSTSLNNQKNKNKLNPMWVEIGTGTTARTSNDVVAAGRAHLLYAQPNDENQVSKIVKSYQKTSTYYVSVPYGEKTIGRVEARVANRNQKGQLIMSPTFGGPASAGGVVRADSPLKLEVAYHCKATGVSPVLVTVHLPGTGSVSWRIIKVCGGFKPKVDWYWTAPHVLAAAAGLILAFGCCYAAYKVRKDFDDELAGNKGGGATLNGSAPDDFELDSMGAQRPTSPGAVSREDAEAQLKLIQSQKV